MKALSIERHRFERRLTAIAFADVAGFSRHVGRDDAGTIASWKALRRNLIEPRITENRGRLLRVVGDGLFISFQSAVDAVSWASDIQVEMAEHRPDSGPSLQLRIGINVEDVLIDEDDLHGDGVNIAARIQALAEPGGIFVTGAVRDYVWNKVDFGLTDMGERALKNITQPVRIFRVDPANSARRPVAPSASQPRGASIKRPTIAVLPFENLGHNPDEDYFGEGMTEDIITALSKSRSLFVIARDSTLRYRDRKIDNRQIASELGVRYLLKGSVRRHADQLRISAALIDVDRNVELWSNKFDGSNKDLFEFQDRIASSIVATVEPWLYSAESEFALSKPTEHLDAYDLVLRSLPLFNRLSNDDFKQAATNLDRSIELDPRYAHAHAYRAWLYLLMVAEAHSGDIVADAAKAREHVQAARNLDPADPFVLAVAAHVTSLLHRQPDLAAELFDQSLDLNQNSVFAWGMSGLTYCYLGQPEQALARFGRVWELSPFDPMIFFYTAGAGLAEFLAGRYDKALPWLRKALRVNARFVAGQRHLTTCLVHLDRIDDARKSAADLLAIQPGFRVAAFASWYPLRPHESLDRYVAGLRAAGLPE